MRVRFLFIAIVSITIVSCDKDKIRQEEFTLWGAYSDEGQLRMDGAYISSNDLILTYSDGIVYHTFSSGCEVEMDTESTLVNCGPNENRDSYQHWGAFDIEQDVFRIQSFQQRAGGQLGDLHVWKYNGIVVNDSTLIVNEFIDHNGNEMKLPIDTFRFVRIDKPDSMNIILDEIGAP